MQTTSAARKLQDIVVGLAGNPNSGKTSMFNNLTGARHQVGNWPGVTVEKKEGRLVQDGQGIRVVDLPGTYSLGAYSEDEAVARNYILSGEPDLIINIIDASNLERNLYLTTQLLEMGANLVLALNMIDEAEKRHIKIDLKALAGILSVPVVPTVAVRNKGTQELVLAAVSVADRKQSRPFAIDYGKEAEPGIARLEKALTGVEAIRHLPARWVAVKLLEGDEHIYGRVMQSPKAGDIIKKRDEVAAHIESMTGLDPESLFADRRYGFIAGLIKETVTRKSTTEERLSISDRIDRVVTNRFLGIPIFFLSMFAVFQFTFSLGDPLIGYVEEFFEWLGEGAGALFSNELVASLVADGIIGGVGAVLVFIPPIFLIFFAITLLEDSGYMARAAYIMDRFMHRLGLHGKSFIPLIVGFGCNVPAIMACRTLENKRDRMITILITPLMSCAARLPIYVLFVGAFFTAYQGLIIFSLYILGIALAIMMGILFKRFLFKGEVSPFVMELPPYRVPTLKGMLIHMWERGWAFIKRAGTIIFSVVILIWVFATLPTGVEFASRESYLGAIGGFVAPVFAPLGFGTWEAAAALIFGLLAKEVVVGMFGVIYGIGEDGLTVAIQAYWTPLSAYAFMVMSLIYIPCVATIATIKRETNSWRWTGFAMAYSLLLGWTMAFLVYQGGRLLGLG
ncbi:MAG: ferrous iron transport protein B [Eubacteriales bacterium]|nr:ferrous iron transport protein B [Bacillota bacterium]MBV1726479.1 ferrous iron transport protein B [Desulforudis sp.]MDZ4042379.1 ferrous iron transport protein B [Eubacteriales bacterium]MBU4554266.1 ferrous iron transport protein B [Bacillota bacterium]MBV1735165.1 ferrous iron transport protein B [Desulforudis sp.]